MSYVPERGDFVYLDFDPTKGHEQAGHRPALILSPKLFNQSTGFTVVCPITNQIKGYPFEEEIHHPRISGVVLVDQVKSLDIRARNIYKTGECDEDLIKRCINKIKTFLY